MKRSLLSLAVLVAAQATTADTRRRQPPAVFGTHRMGMHGDLAHRNPPPLRPIVSDEGRKGA